VVGERPGDEDAVARADGLGPEASRPSVGAFQDLPDAAGVDEHLVGASPLDDFRVAADHRDARLACRRSRRVEHAPQERKVQPLLQDQRQGQGHRPRPQARQVVDGARDGQPPDVAAGKLERPHDVGIRREGERSGLWMQARGIGQARQFAA